MGTSNSTNRAARSATPVIGTPVAQGTPASAAPSTPAPAPATAAKLDLVFTMDCTGSMGSYIHAAKTNIEAIVSRLAAAEGYDLRFGLVAYRDHPPQDHTFVTKSFSFTEDVAQMKANLRTLSAAGGGDGPEAVAAGLKATLDAAWREDATKVAILIADAPPHGLGEAGDGFPNGAPDGVDPLVVLDEMSMKGISVYSVGCQPALSRYRYATDFFIAVAEKTNGQAVSLGSAAALADVIMGGAIEEMDLEKLADEVRSEVQSLQQAHPAMAEEEVQERVWRGLQQKGRCTRQMKTKRLQSASAQVVCKATSLKAARSAYEAAGPPPPPPSAMAGMGLMAARAAPSRAPMRRASASAARSLRRSRPLSIDDDDDDEAEEEDFAPVYRSGSFDDVEEAGSSVKLEEDTVSYEQVARLYGKGKKKGMW